MIVVPDYYKEFKCIADHCKHTCCKGWEVEIDDESLKRFQKYPDIMEKVECLEDNHFKLLEDDVCPFLQRNGLCEMILKYGENMICQTCTDHPRFRNFWNDRVEMGLGMVCEEAARLILSKNTPMHLEILDGMDGDSQIEDASALPPDEAWLMDVRNNLLSSIREIGPIARLREYLIYRHIADALYDDRLEERIQFVDLAIQEIKEKWKNTDGSLDALCEIVRCFSYDIEYDEEAKEKIFEEIEQSVK